MMKNNWLEGFPCSSKPKLDDSFPWVEGVTVVPKLSHTKMLKMTMKVLFAIMTRGTLTAEKSR